MAGACSVAGCERSTVAKGLCKLHYQRMQRHAAAVGSRPRNRQTVVHAERTSPAQGSEADLRRGRIRRAIEDRELALRLRRECGLEIEGDW